MAMRQHMVGSTIIILGTALLGTGCSGMQRGPAVPFSLQDRAVVPGMLPAIRTWGSAFNPEFAAELVQSVQREQAYLAASGHAGPLPRADFLAISGGGANGAFGAGLLNGWTATGDRPVFKAVTGISTGALIAPFAFLGPDYDATLHRFYTEITTRDIATRRSMLGGMTKDALTDSRPLRRLLEQLIDEKMVEQIKAEHAKGRLLAILTTNIDARRAVIWNVTAIAASDHPDAPRLIRDIMLASASIPAAFPPVMIDVEVDGQHYQEMHVDGGCMTQVFLYPPSVRLDEMGSAAGIARERRLYIVRNSAMEPEWAETPRQTLSIAGRAIGSLISTQGLGDLYRIYLNAERDKIDYNLAYIPNGFKVESKEAFDPTYMTALYQVGYDLARGGYPWAKTPPGFEAPAR